MALIKALLVAIVLIVLATTVFVWSGRYSIGADAPHWRITERTLEILRDRSIEESARGTAVPNLDDAQRVAEGAEHYAAMCTGCHLAPGLHDSELRAGLYPVPPNFSDEPIDDPATAFWVIKHGVKLTAMPAWGRTHNDDAIWNLVAFLKKLPGMTPEQYTQMTTNSGAHHHHGDADSHDAHPGDSDAHHDHEHGEGEASPHEHGGDAPAHGGHDDAPAHDHPGGADEHHAEAATAAVDRTPAPRADEQRQAEVRARGPDVMAFSLDATQHVFENTAHGGVQRVVVRDGHADQVAPVRSHLRAIAQAFSARDFSGPTHIHGAGMPGLAELQPAPANALTANYRDIERGGEVSYAANTPALVDAVHRWFGAQLADHGRDASEHMTHQ